jgi:outer membrane protein TolC
MKGRFFLLSVLMLTLVALSVPNRPAWAEKYTLERCIEIALKVSPTVGISRENLASTRTNVLQAYGGFLPNANLSFNVGRNFAGPTSGVLVDAQGRPIPIDGSQYDTYQLSVNGGLMLFNWGANIRRLQQTRHTAEAAVYDLEYQKDFIKAVMIREYYDQVRWERLRKVREEDVALNTRNLEQVEAFYNIGSRTKADFLQARVTLANSELQLLNAQNSLELAQARLVSRLNMPVMTVLDLDESVELIPEDVDITGEVEYMMSHRADLLGSKERVIAADYNVSALKDDRYPDLTAYYSYSWNNREWNDFLSMFEENYFWTLGIGLSWNIFDRFVTKSNVLNAEANRRIADYDKQRSEIDAMLELQQIIVNLNQARQRRDLAAETVTYAQENVRLAEERYRVGAGTILETIQASASLTEASASLIEAQIDYLVNHADLQRATGRPVRTR